MRLFLNTTSPYARLIQVLLLETGLAAETELVQTDPWNADAALLVANAAAKIPALSLDDGTHLIESTCIADYLIHRSGKAMLSPLSHADGPARLEILGLGRAAMDCAFGSVIQDRFVAGSPLATRWLDALPRIAARLDGLYAGRAIEEGCDLADLTVAVAFDYIDFRLSAADWRADAPQLALSLATFASRPSLASTRPA
jgi:glutathione S-transferase